MRHLSFLVEDSLSPIEILLNKLEQSPGPRLLLLLGRKKKRKTSE
jgi:hypothetical protein